MKPEDFVTFVFPSAPEISPDGSTIIFVVKKIDEEKNSYKSALYKRKLSESVNEKFTLGKSTDFNPKFSPDGKFIAFLSTRSGLAQLYVQKLDGGESYQLTDFPTSITDFRWNATGSKFVLLSEVTQKDIDEATSNKPQSSFVQDPVEYEVKKVKDKVKKDMEKDPRVITEGYYREGTKYFDNRFKQIFILNFINPFVKDIAEDEKDEKPVHISEFGWHYAIGDFSTDAKFVYLLRMKDPTISWKTELVEVNAENRSMIKRATFESEILVPLKLSPNGKNIIFNGPRINSELKVYDNQQIFLYSLDNNTFDLICLTKDYFWSATLCQWLDDNSIVFLTNKNSITTINKIDINTGNVTTLLEQDQMINAFAVSNNGKMIVYESSQYTNPIDIYTFNLETKENSRITETNKYFKNSEQLAILKTIPFTRDNISFQGWLLLPPDYESKEKIPIVLEIHGGPAGMWSPHVKTMWMEFQLLVARGYAVFFCNPRGSDGYGIDFRKALYQNWGDLAGKDILAGLETALKENPILDSSNIFVTGGSYGGYMTGWLVTHDTRFKAAVSQRGVYEFTSFAQTTDIPLWFEYQYNFEMIDRNRTELYERDSPAFQVKNIQCPLLIIHSDNDFRVPIVNAEQFFWLAKRYGKTVEFIRYPRDGHELSRSGEPRHIIDRLTRIINWFDKFKD